MPHQTVPTLKKFSTAAHQYLSGGIILAALGRPNLLRFHTTNLKSLAHCTQDISGGTTNLL